MSAEPQPGPAGRAVEGVACPSGAAALHPDGPWAGFPVAAAAAVADLQRRFGHDLWFVSAGNGPADAQQVVAADGPWASQLAPGLAPGLVLSWAPSLSARIVAGGGPVFEPDLHRSAGSGPLVGGPDGPQGRIRSHLGVSLRAADGVVFGTLCATSGQPRPVAAMSAALAAAQVLGRMLSTIRASEQLAADRSRDAVDAHALAARDQLTGLRNRRGWQDALTAEQERCLRYGAAASVVVLDLDGLKTVNDLAGHRAGDDLLVSCSQVLTTTCRPGDVLSRLGGDEFGVLAVECDVRSAHALQARLRVHLRTAGVQVSLGGTTRRHGETLSATWQRADEAMYQAKRHRQARLLTNVARTPGPPAADGTCTSFHADQGL